MLKLLYRRYFYYTLLALGLAMGVAILCLPQTVRKGSGETGTSPTEERVVEVNAAGYYSASGKDDIALMRSYFHAASWEAPIPPETWERLKPLGISGVRLINVESRRAVTRVSNSGTLDFDFSLLQPGLDDCRKYHLIPHIVVGQEVQELLAHRVGSRVYGIANVTAYENYAFALLRFVVLEQGFAGAIFEVSNEPDTNGAEWLLLGQHESGSSSMYRAYFQLFSAWAHAAARFSQAYPNAMFQLGGPAITPYTLAYGQVEWARQFVDDVVKNKLRLDYFSFHLYGDQQALSGEPVVGPYPTVSATLIHYRTLLRKTKLDKLPLFVTEWGPCSSTDEGHCGSINGNEVGAAWTAKFLIEMADYGLEAGTALILRDHLTEDGRHDNWGWPAFLLADGRTPKAIYNVALLFSKMASHRVAVSGADDHMRVIASIDESRVTVMVTNQNWDYDGSIDRVTNKNLRIKLHHLPFQADRVRVSRYLVDGTHSNAFYSRRMGALNHDGASTLERIAEFTVRVDNGEVTLPSVKIKGSSVTYWEISRDS